LDTGAVSVRKVIYNGAATDLDGERVHLAVYYIGPMSYEFQVSGRRKRICQQLKLIDKGDMIPMFARHYDLSDIQLDRIFRPSSEGGRHPVASANVVSLQQKPLTA
jgi:hypothetical protein